MQKYKIYLKALGMQSDNSVPIIFIIIKTAISKTLLIYQITFINFFFLNYLIKVTPILIPHHLFSIILCLPQNLIYHSLTAFFFSSFLVLC